MAAQSEQKLIDLEQENNQELASSFMSEIELYKYWQDRLKESKHLSDVSEKAIKPAEVMLHSSEDLKFARMYSALIHSGKYTEQLIKLEYSYRPAVDDMFKTRDLSLNELQTKSAREIELAISQLGQEHTESTISSLSSRHCQDMERLLNNWNMSIEALKDAQREDFHEKLEILYKDLMDAKGGGDDHDDDHDHEKDFSREARDILKHISNCDILATTKNDATTISMEDLSLEASSPIQMEESFTINLGAQLKTAHNLRILAVESLYLCDPKCNRSCQMRIQTAMSLYSHNLSALVLLVDNHFDAYYGIQHDFAQLCNSLNEFHFDNFYKQIQHIRQRVMPAYAGRKNLELGDCYVTRHTNLANVHVIFHLVTDDSLKSTSVEVNSRHLIMASLRNILRVAHMYDIKTISIPLLLVDEMDEEILTVNWCLKRAELVLKCVKGFLIEMASLSTGVEQGTIQFLVPKGISEELFSSLASLIPEIFRLSNSLVLKSSP